MLKNEHNDLTIEEAKEYLLEYVPEDLQQFIKYREPIQNIHFPVISYPDKVKSLKLDSTPIIEKKLTGIKGQYLMFEDGNVINIRSHSGYLVKFGF